MARAILKSLSTIAIVLLSISCNNKDKLEGIPTAIRISSMDFSEAIALAIIPQSVVTAINEQLKSEMVKGDFRAVDKETKSELVDLNPSFDYKLYAINNDGCFYPIPFILTEIGDCESAKWRKIRNHLSLTAESVVAISNDYVQIAYLRLTCDYDWWEDSSFSEKEKNAISNLLRESSGTYWLRLSDLSLLKGPVLYLSNPVTDPREELTPIQEGKSLVCFPSGVNDIECNNHGPILFLDMGDHIEQKSPTSSVSLSRPQALMITSNDRLIPLLGDGEAGHGTWAYDLNLNSTYIDYTPKVADLLDGHSYIYWCHPDTTYLAHSHSTNHQNATLSLYSIIVKENVVDCDLIQSIIVSNDYEHYYNDIKRIWYKNSLIVMGGRPLRVNLDTSDIVEDETITNFPNDYSIYDKTGVTFVCYKDRIAKYSIDSGTIESIPIADGKSPFDWFVSIDRMEYFNGLFLFSGLTRSAESSTLLVNAKSGMVSELNITLYSGDFFKSFCYL